MKKIKIIALAAIAAISLASCTEESYILLKDSDNIAIAGFALTSSAFSDTYTVETSDGSTWNAGIDAGIPGMTINPISGKSGDSITISVPENTGASREGVLYISTKKVTKEVPVKQSGR